jgi:hypothetical protein
MAMTSEKPAKDLEKPTLGLPDGSAFSYRVPIRMEISVFASSC